MTEKNKSGEHRADPCCECHEALEKRVDGHSDRIDKQDGKIETHDKRLSLGDVGFAEVRKDIQSLTEKVSSLLGAVWWLVAAVFLGLLGAAGSALAWVFMHMGAKP